MAHHVMSDATNDHFLSWVQQVEIQTSPSRPLAIPTLKRPAIGGESLVECIHLPRFLVICKMQTASTRIWTRVPQLISYDDSHVYERLNTHTLTPTHSPPLSLTYTRKHTHTHTHIYIYIYIYIYANFIKHNRHFMSTYFLLDPFEFPYYFYRIQGELI